MKDPPIENKVELALPKPSSEEFDSLDHCGPSIGGEVGFVGLSG